MKLLKYSVKNSVARKLTFTLTVLGIGLVVFVFTAVLMLSNGLEKVLVDTGRPDNVTILRDAANTEVVSIIDMAQADVIKVDPAIARDSNGVPMIAGELVVLISQPRIDTQDESNITIRGVDDMSWEIRPQVKLAAGRRFRPGTSEIVVGTKVAQDFQGCQLGDTLRFGLRDWEIVGLIEAGSSGFESEIWGDVDQFMGKQLFAMDCIRGILSCTEHHISTIGKRFCIHCLCSFRGFGTGVYTYTTEIPAKTWFKERTGRLRQRLTTSSHGLNLTL